MPNIRESQLSTPIPEKLKKINSSQSFNEFITICHLYPLNDNMLDQQIAMAKQWLRVNWNNPELKKCALNYTEDLTFGNFSILYPVLKNKIKFVKEVLPLCLQIGAPYYFEKKGYQKNTYGLLDALVEEEDLSFAMNFILNFPDVYKRIKLPSTIDNLHRLMNDVMSEEKSYDGIYYILFCSLLCVSENLFEKISLPIIQKLAKEYFERYPSGCQFMFKAVFSCLKSNNYDIGEQFLTKRLDELVKNNIVELNHVLTMMASFPVKEEYIKTNLLEVIDKYKAKQEELKKENPFKKIGTNFNNLYKKVLFVKKSNPIESNNKTKFLIPNLYHEAVMNENLKLLDLLKECNYPYPKSNQVKILPHDYVWKEYNLEMKGFSFVDMNSFNVKTKIELYFKLYSFISSDEKYEDGKDLFTRVLKEKYKKSRDLDELLDLIEWEADINWLQKQIETFQNNVLRNSNYLQEQKININILEKNQLKGFFEKINLKTLSKEEILRDVKTKIL